MFLTWWWPASALHFSIYAFLFRTTGSPGKPTPTPTTFPPNPHRCPEICNADANSPLKHAAANQEGRRGCSLLSLNRKWSTAGSSPSSSLLLLLKLFLLPWASGQLMRCRLCRGEAADWQRLWLANEWQINLKPIKALTSMTIFPLGVFVQQ